MSKIIQEEKHNLKAVRLQGLFGFFLLLWDVVPDPQELFTETGMWLFPAPSSQGWCHLCPECIQKAAHSRH